MKEISPEELKQLQLNILDVVDRFCTEHSIKYSMACGTLLGAVRHKGYIPWDDDIDIYMLREDYNKFEELFPEEYLGHFCLGSLKRRNDWTLAFAKVYDNRTFCVEKRSKGVNPGVNIDIFIIDDVPDDDKEWQIYNKKRRSHLIHLRHAGLKVSKINSFVKNCGAIVFSFLYFFTSMHKIALKIDKIAQKNNGRGYHRVFETTGRKSLFDELVDMPFENRTYKAFKDYDEYLSSVFGNYMTPPPLDKRVSFHTFDAYWR